MRRKVQVLATCCLAVCLVLGGCAKEEPPLEAPAETDASPSEVPAEPEEEATEEDLDAFLAKLETMSDDELDVLLGDESLTDDEFNALIEVMDARTAAREADKEPHGIIALVMKTGGTDSYDIISINPNSGEVRPIQSFSVQRSPFTENGSEYNYLSLYSPYFYVNYRDLFSPDYNKLAVSKVDRKSNEAHAGWINSDGTFTDVTETLNPGLHDGFYETVYQYAVGFDDDSFIYRDGRALNDPSYSTQASTLSASSVAAEYTLPTRIVSNTSDYSIGLTDTIDSENCLVDYVSKSMWEDDLVSCRKYNIATEELSDFIPITSRYNWSGVLSPDNTMVAFLSKPNETDGNAEIFTIPISGGDPVKIDMASSLQTMYGNINMEAEVGKTCCFLLDWLE